MDNEYKSLGENIVETIHMSLGKNFGSLLTDTFRNMAWFNSTFEKATESMEHEFPELTTNQIEDLLNGKLAFQTSEDDVSVELVSDEWIAPNWKLITETLVNLNGGAFMRNSTLRGLGLKPINSDSVMELAESAYDYLYSDRKHAYQFYMDMMTEVKRIRVYTGDEGAFDVQHPMLQEPNAIVSKDLTNIRNGWLSPQGTFYECKHYQHDSLADILHTEGSKGLEKQNWIRLCEGEWLCLDKIGFMRATEKQMDTVEEWQSINAKDAPIYWNSIPYTYAEWLRGQISDDKL
jgi:hypothetical protein